MTDGCILKQSTILSNINGNNMLVLQVVVVL